MNSFQPSSSRNLNNNKITLSYQMLLQFKNIYQHEQSIIILVAIPGCGKSTLANYIVKNSVNSSHLEWASVNQDVYKSRGRTLEAAEEYLLQGKSVIIDRCNFDARQRSTWIELSKKFNIPSICLVLPHYDDLNLCSQRAYSRGNDGIHEEDADWFRICGLMKSNFRLPSYKYENMTVNAICKTDADLDYIKNDIFLFPLMSDSIIETHFENVHVLEFESNILDQNKESIRLENVEQPEEEQNHHHHNEDEEDVWEDIDIINTDTNTSGNKTLRWNAYHHIIRKMPLIRKQK